MINNQQGVFLAAVSSRKIEDEARRFAALADIAREKADAATAEDWRWYWSAQSEAYAQTVLALRKLISKSQIVSFEEP
jgi:hypothetical protein